MKPPRLTSDLRALLGAAGCLLSVLAVASAAPVLPNLPAPPPAEPSTHISVITYHAVGDGTTDNTTYFQNAINAAAAVKGGAVVDVPNVSGANIYMIGSITLASNVWLNVESGATIEGSNSTADYPETTERWQGNDVICYRGLIAASNATNIAIIGSGSILGPSNFAGGGGDTATTAGIRNPVLIEPRNCSGVLIENITAANYHMWTLHPTYCQDVTIQGVTTLSQHTNSDGCDPDSCARVLIDNCNFTSGDDDIAIKSGKGTAGAAVGIPCQDVTIENCTFTNAGGGSGGVAFGSEISGGIERVLIQNNTFKLSGSKQIGLFLKTREGNGGYINEVTAESNTFDCLVLWIQTDYSNSDYGANNGPISGLPGVTAFNNILVTGATVDSSDAVVTVGGDATRPINNLTLSNFSGSAGSGANTVDQVTAFTASGISVSGAPALTETNIASGITISPDAAAIAAGVPSSFAVTVPSGLSGTVSLSVIGDGVAAALPPGVTAAFSPASFSSGSGSSTLTLSTASSTLAGNYSIIVQASNGTDTRTAAATLTVSNYEAEGLSVSSTSGVATSIQDDSNSSGGEWVELEAGAIGQEMTFTLPTSVPAGTYAVQMKWKGNTNRGQLSLSIDGTQVGSTLDQYSAVETYPITTFGNVTFGSAGTHKITLSVTGENGSATGKYLSADSFILAPLSTNLIASSLSYTTSGATASLQTDTAFSNPDTWVELEASGAGPSITYTTPSIASGVYQLQMTWKGNTNRGQLSVSVDGGAPLTPDPLDQYSMGETYPITTFSPNLTFSSTGTHTIKLTVTGKNGSSTGFYLSTYNLLFTPQ